MIENNVVMTVAKIIDDKRAHPIDCAKTILKLMLPISRTYLKDQIIEFEREQWRKSGFPDEFQELNIERDKIINDSYSGALF